MRVEASRPFALSLSKPVLSDAAGGVEGSLSKGAPEPSISEPRFDKLSVSAMETLRG